MANSANNITTQWTFRDGRDYVLSLTTTESPNTVSFWISDKITGEEWTGCYDESGIEVLTKRTGCYKNFQTFLSMVKSAILKKSESVVLDLLNIEDLAVISLQRQNSVCEEGVHIPPNFQLYNCEINGNPIVGSGSSLGRNGKLHQPADVAIGITSNSHKPSLNKRKYLIVTYVGEFDKVHYPFPLNYSNPPDLNVMQTNIIKLKAEVTSLKNAKNELQDQLESIKSGSVPPTGDDKSVSKNNENAEQNADIGGDKQAISNGQDRSHNITIPCTSCTETFVSLKLKIRDLEDAICFQREEHSQIVEQLENENHFLRHKVEASEKYELELWNQIQQLKEKVGRKRVRDKEMKSDPMKDPRRKSIHQSRHDLFFNSNHRGRSNSFSGNVKVTGNQVKRTTSPNIRQSTKWTAAANQQSRSRSDSNSTNSHRSSKTVTINRANVQAVHNIRSRSSSYQSISFKDLNNNRQTSVSPARRPFDPTAYVKEKKMKQSQVAKIRMQKIESRIRLGSRSQSRLSPPHSPSKKSIPVVSPLIMPNGDRPDSRGYRSQTISKGKRPGTNGIEDSRPSTVDRLEKRRNDSANNSKYTRPYSAASAATKGRLTFDTRQLEKMKNSKGGNAKYEPMQPNKDIITKDKASMITSQIGHRVITRRVTPLQYDNRNYPSVGGAARTSSQFEAGGPAEKLPETNWQNEPSMKDQQGQNCDIVLLQNKLSALQAFLETCKPTG